MNIDEAFQREIRTRLSHEKRLIAYLHGDAAEPLHSSRSDPVRLDVSLTRQCCVRLTGTAARIEKAPAPATNRNAMNSATWVLPAKTAPEIIFSDAALKISQY
jgi:hypothetical protein